MESVAPNAVAQYCCGGPTTKPFYDGTHSGKIGFRVAQGAVRQEEEQV